MKKNEKLLFILMGAAICFLCASCQRTSSQTWENIKTAGSYLNKGFDALWGKDGDARLLRDGEFLGPEDQEFISLNDSDLKTCLASTERAMPQSKIVPGEKGGPVPEIANFKTPQGELASLFKQLNFDTDDHVIRSREDLMVIQKIAIYLKRNPQLYLAIEGHCDERASAAYNMALGTRRANHTRVLLIKQGVDFNRLYAISYGKEKPKTLGHSPEDWRLNRRIEFKTFSR